MSEVTYTIGIFDSVNALPCDIARFLEKCDHGADTECWLWKGNKKDGGYGLFWFNGKMVRAHRFSFSTFYGVTLTPDEVLCHACDTPLCVNPHHLWVGSRADNAADMHSKGRAKTVAEYMSSIRRTGADSASSKLADDQIIEIRLRRQAGESLVQLSSAFDVVESVISEICRGKAWPHVPGPTTGVHGNAILNEQQIAEIRRRVLAGGERRKDIAADYGVTPRTIEEYVGRKNRKTGELVVKTRKYVGPNRKPG